MADIRWQGGAKAVAQVNTFAFAGTWEADDVVRLTVGSKTVDVTAGSTSAATIVSTVSSAWNALSASSYPEFAEITASANSTTLTLTADTAGKPFTATITPLEANLSSADAQTIEGTGTATTGTAATASSGPNDWSTAANWSGGAVPGNSDNVYFDHSDDDVLYGLAQSGVTLTSLTVDSSFTGTIGLPTINEDATEYYEYRPLYLAISATTVTIGGGDGTGSGRIKINVGSNQTTVTVRDTGSPAETSLPAFILKGTHSSNALNVWSGSVGVAVFGGETSTLATLRVGFVSSSSDAEVTIGSGVTLSSCTLSMSGGECTINSAISAVSIVAGELTVAGTGTVGTLTVDGGTVNYNTSGTCSTAIVSGDGATVNLAQDMRGKTFSTVDLFAGATWIDSFGVGTYSAGLDLNRCRLDEVSVNLGENWRLTKGSVS